MIVLGSMKDIYRISYDELWFLESNMDWFLYEKIEKPKYHKGKYDKSKINQRNFQLLMQPNVKQVDELCPGHDLNSYIILHKFQHKDLDSALFINKIVPSFLSNIDNENGRRRLNELFYLDKINKVILLVCVEKTDLSHRNIIGCLLKQVGVNVNPNGFDIEFFKEKTLDFFKK